MRRGRRVRRVIRKIDPWSVLKISIFVFISMVVVLIIGTVILWSVAQSSGAVGKIENFMQELGFTDFRFEGDQIFRLVLFGGGAFVVAGTVFAVIMAFMYNLISDLVGGIEVQVIEEEAVLSDIDPSRRRRFGRRPKPAKRPKPPPRGGPQQGAPPPGGQRQRQPVPQRRTVV